MSTFRNANTETLVALAKAEFDGCAFDIGTFIQKEMLDGGSLLAAKPAELRTAGLPLGLAFKLHAWAGSEDKKTCIVGPSDDEEIVSLEILPEDALNAARKRMCIAPRGQSTTSHVYPDVPKLGATASNTSNEKQSPAEGDLDFSKSIVQLISHQIFNDEGILRYLDVDSAIKLRWTCRAFYKHLDWVTLSIHFTSSMTHSVAKSMSPLPHGLDRMQWCLGLIRNDRTGFQRWGNDEMFASSIVCIHADGVYFDFIGHDQGPNEPPILQSADRYYRHRCPFTKGKFGGFTIPKSGRHLLGTWSTCGRGTYTFATVDGLKLDDYESVTCKLTSPLWLGGRGFECITFTIYLTKPTSKNTSYMLRLQINDAYGYVS